MHNQNRVAELDFHVGRFMFHDKKFIAKSRLSATKDTTGETASAQKNSEKPYLKVDITKKT